MMVQVGQTKLEQVLAIGATTTGQVDIEHTWRVKAES